MIKEIEITNLRGSLGATGGVKMGARRDELNTVHTCETEKKKENVHGGACDKKTV